jgi:hypothetical protein
MGRLALIFLLATAAFAANIRLYLKDGDFQLVREYKVEGDRVRMLSADRNEWEEIPLELIDLPRTEKESASQRAMTEAKQQLDRAEDEAIRADKRLVESVPTLPGPYLVEGTSLKPLTESQVTLENSATRRILQILAPAPIIAGKTTVTIAGKSAKLRFKNPEPEFFFRLAEEERFVIIQLDPKKDERVVEVVTILPNEEGIFEDQKQVPVFKKQHAPRLHKIWPENALAPGEYALVEYTDGKINPRVWDFAIDK